MSGTNQIGTSGPDTLTGNDNADTLAGVAGNDSLVGLAGADSLNGGDGADTLDGGTGTDSLIGGGGDDVHVVDNTGDVVTEAPNSGTDLVRSSISYTLGTEVENLTLLGADSVPGLSGTGNGVGNLIIGTGGANTLNGLAGADTLQGGGGDDLYIVDNTGDIVTEAANGGTDIVESSVTYTLAANVENLTLTGATAINGTGNGSNNYLRGNSGDNTLSGGDGADTLEGGAGIDTMSGGQGNDVFIVTEVGESVIEGVGGGTDTVRTTVTNYILGETVENLVLTGSAQRGRGNVQGNVITATAGANTLDGLEGADTLQGGTGDDLFVVDNVGDIATDTNGGADTVQSTVTYSLGAGVDHLLLQGTDSLNGLSGTGNTLNNQITGTGGANTLNGGTGTDTLIGGAGSDVYIVDVTGDVVTEVAGAGTDLVESSATYTLAANVENLTLTGGAAINGTGNDDANWIIGNGAANVLSGAGGADTLDGGIGTDTMNGGLGNDVFIVNTSGDVVNENASSGTDLVESSATYTLSAHVENLTLTGGAAIHGTGNNDANWIIGNTAANTLSGAGGADTLDGGTGADTLEGGGDDDTFIVDDAADVVNEASGFGIDTVRSSVTHTLAANVENLVLLGSAAIHGTGNAGANQLTGNDAANTLDGGSGADTLEGGLGDDVFVVDNLGDRVTEGVETGVDLVRSSVNYTLDAEVENLLITSTTGTRGTGNALFNVITGNDGADTLNGGEGSDTLEGGKGDDLFIVDNASDVVRESFDGGADTVESTVTYTLLAGVERLTLVGINAINGTGNDQDNEIFGNTATNRLWGGNGADTLDGGAGADTLEGGFGSDVFIVDNTLDRVTETQFGGFDDLVRSTVTHTLDAWVENLILEGNGTIHGTGNAQANEITGNSAGNTLDGGTGADTLIGGAGNDVYVVDNTLDRVNEDLNAGIDTVRSSANHTLRANVEHLILTDGAVSGTGNDLDNVITGTGAANTLDGDLGADTLYGGAGNDVYIVDNANDVVDDIGGGTDLVRSSVNYVLGSGVENLILTGTAVSGTGNTGDNRITANSGAQTLDGGAGHDTLEGGAGNDVYIVDDTDDEVIEILNNGVDRVESSVDYVLGAHVDNLVLTGTAVSGTGNTLANRITGNGGANTLNGGSGADTLEGGAGDDVYVVDNGADRVIEDGNAGIDSVEASINYALQGGVENLTLTGSGNINGTGNVLANRITGNGGANTLNGGSGTDTLEGLGGNDVYIVDNAGDVVIEAFDGGIDRVEATWNHTLSDHVEHLSFKGARALQGTGNGLNNQITGNSGANRLDGGSGADTLQGAGGNDVYIVDNVGDVVIETINSGRDRVESSISFVLGTHVENLTLLGSDNINGTGNDRENWIIGNGGANSLEGGANRDTLEGGGGDDTMSGGIGSDVYEVTDAGDVVIELENAGTDLVRSTIDYTLTAHVENLTLEGSGNLRGTGNARDNVITGNGGANTLDGGVGADTMLGGFGDDLYIVNFSRDRVLDSSRADGGLDRVESSISYSLARATGVENLTLTGIGNTSGTGNSLNNLMIGNIGANSLIGGAGNDTLDGGLGNDTLEGGVGNDVYIVDSLGDVVTERQAAGIDRVESSVTYTLSETVENLILTGSSNIGGTGSSSRGNEITGNTGANLLDGRAGNDTLQGGEGGDTLVGGTGGDLLTGGADTDVFRYSLVDDSNAAGRDTISDFATGDRIDLSAIDANTTLSGDEAFAFIGGANFTGAGGQLRFVVDGSDGILQADTDGVTSTIEFEVRLAGVTTLSAGDLIL